MDHRTIAEAGRIRLAMLCMLTTAGLLLCGAADEAKDKAAEEKLRQDVKKTGLSRERRLAIWREMCAGDDRAMWEANRLFDPADEGDKLTEYNSEAIERYRKLVCSRNKITKETLWTIELEAADENRKPPEYPSCDVPAVAKQLKLNVYVAPGKKKYHRRNCPTVDEDDLKTITIYRAVTTPGLLPCDSCKP